MKIVDKIQIKNQGQIVKFWVNAQNFWSNYQTTGKKASNFELLCQI